LFDANGSFLVAKGSDDNNDDADAPKLKTLVLDWALLDEALNGSVLNGSELKGSALNIG
jgi:hypothetical protein